MDSSSYQKGSKNFFILTFSLPITPLPIDLRSQVFADKHG